MVKRRKEEAQETRERILDAAITVFHERGVARPSLTEIAVLAGVTRGAVYGHFRNKADLFGALADRVRLPGETFDAAGEQELQRNPLGTLRERWVFLFEEVARNPEWRRILEIIFHRCELVAESGEIRERLLRGREEGIARMTLLMQQAVKARQLPASLDIPASVQFLHGSLIGVLQDWLFEPASFDLSKEGVRYLDALIDVLHTSERLRR